MTYQWTCTAGGFLHETDTTPHARWVPPLTPQTGIEVKCTVDDSNLPGRDDPQKEKKATGVIAYRIACTQVEATYDVDVYWPVNDPHQTDVIWKINSQNWQEHGWIDDDTNWEYYAVADFHRPVTQYYKLTFTLGRWPSCQTTQTPRLNVNWTYLLSGDTLQAEGSGWVVAFWVPDFTCVSWDSYHMDLSFYVKGRFIHTAHRVPVNEIKIIDQYHTYGMPLCPVEERDTTRFFWACEWGQYGSEEADVAHNVMWKINDRITRGCICPGEWSSAWDDYIWSNAIPGSASDGMCCCRAHGMMLALQVLGTPLYQHVYVNEFPEPGENEAYPGDEGQYCQQCDATCWRQAWWGAPDPFWNNYEGACEKDLQPLGWTCYAPAGHFEGTYLQIRQAFGPWYWVWGSGQGDICPHMAPP